MQITKRLLSLMLDKMALKEFPRHLHFHYLIHQFRHLRGHESSRLELLLQCLDLISTHVLLFLNQLNLGTLVVEID